MHLWRDIRAVGGQIKRRQYDAKRVYPLGTVALYSVLSLEMQGPLFPRSCYDEIFNIVQANKGTYKFLLLGSSGIGKSVCLLYFLVRLSSRQNTVIVFNDLDGTKHLFCSGLDAAFLLEGSIVAFKNLLLTFCHKGMDVYHLFDAGTKGSKTERINPVPGVKLIVAASPDLANYNQYLKSTPKMLFMEPWRFEELVRFNSFLNPPFDDNELKKRYALAGGIPRMVFSVDTDIPDVVGGAMRGLENNQVQRVVQVVKQGFARTNDLQVSHKSASLSLQKQEGSAMSFPRECLQTITSKRWLLSVKPLNFKVSSRLWEC